VGHRKAEDLQSRQVGRLVEIQLEELLIYHVNRELKKEKKGTHVVLLQAGHHVLQKAVGLRIREVLQILQLGGSLQGSQDLVLQLQELVQLIQRGYHVQQVEQHRVQLPMLEQ